MDRETYFDMLLDFQARADYGEQNISFDVYDEKFRYKIGNIVYTYDDTFDAYSKYNNCIYISFHSLMDALWWVDEQYRHRNESLRPLDVLFEDLNN